MPTSFTAATTRTAGAVRKGDRSELLPVAQVITSPAHIATIPKFAGEIRFEKVER